MFFSPPVFLRSNPQSVALPHDTRRQQRHTSHVPGTGQTIPVFTPDISFFAHQPGNQPQNSGRGVTGLGNSPPLPKKDAKNQSQSYTYEENIQKQVCVCIYIYICPESCSKKMRKIALTPKECIGQCPTKMVTSTRP